MHEPSFQEAKDQPQIHGVHMRKAQGVCSLPLSALTIIPVVGKINLYSIEVSHFCHIFMLIRLKKDSTLRKTQTHQIGISISLYCF